LTDLDSLDEVKDIILIAIIPEKINEYLGRHFLIKFMSVILRIKKFEYKEVIYYIVIATAISKPSLGLAPYHQWP
jgi:hypothetical protein